MINMFNTIFNKKNTDTAFNSSQNKNHQKDLLYRYIETLENTILKGDLNSILMMNGDIENKIDVTDVRKFSSEYRKIIHIEGLVADLVQLTDEENVSKSGDVFFQTYRDNLSDWVAVFFNLDEFTPGDICNPTLYLSYGKSAVPQSKMYISYYSKGYLEIVDLFSGIERRGHGGLMLNSLLKIVEKLNEKIEVYNLQLYTSEFKNRLTYGEFIASSKSMRKITYITGKMVPGRGLTREDLIRFYGRYGFIIEGHLHKDV